MSTSIPLKRLVVPALVVLVFSLLLIGFGSGGLTAASAAGVSANTAFTQAASESGVPVSVLKTLCYMEGRLSMHGGSPSIDNGYGCMHLVKNQHADTLDQAAGLLHVSVNQVKSDLTTNIRGGAAVLHAEAVQTSSTHSLPTSLAGWYGEIANYSHATLHSTALMYADAFYKLLNSGFNAQTDTGELVTVAAQTVKPDIATAAAFSNSATLPAGCSAISTGDYPAAVNCILDPAIFDCTPATAVYPPCNYEQRTDAGYPLPVNFVVIHDTEGSLQSALDVFQNTDPKTSHGSAANYIVDSDGTVYQMVHDVAFTYNVGNYWYNQHSVGIEHVGFDATGFQWYNAAQYLGSAKLVAYLLTKYHIPLDRNHVVAHGTVPAPFSGGINHVDPGPYWMWDYYFDQIHQQGVAFPKKGHVRHTVELHTKKYLSKGGIESPADFNFYSLYNGPSTASGLIPHASVGTDITDETDNIEADMTYYYVAKVKDQAGTGDMMYEIWYGEADHVQDPTYPSDSTYYADAKLAWVAVPRGTDVTEGMDTLVTLKQSGSAVADVFGDPITRTDGLFLIGDAPNGAVFVSGYKVVEDGATAVWYEINFNHRQAWVPASEVTVVHTA
ncbi:MAG: peptidoglycan recognition family protein [Ktedonobacteraceae bacterium]